LNKPSTPNIGEANMVQSLPGLDIHWGLPVGVALCVIAQVILLPRTTWGFSLRVAGGNPRAALLVGLPVSGLLIAACAFGGAAAGIAGDHLLAVHGTANASLIGGYGFTGILVAFMARQQPLAVVPVAILMGGISAAGSLLQRRLDLPDATTMVLQGLLFMSILTCETLNGQLSAWRERRRAGGAAA
jgi:simple sugar transport system permease protein